MEQLRNVLLCLLFIASPCYAGVNLDGTDDYLSGSGDIDCTNAITIAFWGNIDTTTMETFANFVGEPYDGDATWDDPFYSWTFGVRDPNTTGAFLFSTGGVDDRVEAASYIVDDTWTHYAVTRTGSTVVFYRDGSSFATPAGLDSGDIDNRDNKINIGTRTDQNNDENVAGTMSDIYVWCSALTATQILQLASARIKGIGLQIDPGNLQLYLPLDEGADEVSVDGSTFLDQSGNDRDVTADDGANNTGMTGKAEEVLSYP